MHIERVQRWVMSSLALTTALIFAGGLALSVAAGWYLLYVH